MFALTPSLKVVPFASWRLRVKKKLSHAKAQSREEKVLSTEKAKHSPPTICPDAIPESCSLCVLAPSREKQLSHAKAQSREEKVFSPKKSETLPAQYLP
jgi:hypothetical protein